MTDNNKYINAYVDIAIGTIHEYLAANIQLKAQNKISNDLVSEKDKIISSLQSEIASINKNNSDMQTLQTDAKTWEDSYNAMKNKISHMDALTKQVIEMKKEITLRDEKIKELEDRYKEKIKEFETKRDEKILELEDKLVKLNKKSKKKQQAVAEPKIEKEETILITPAVIKVTEKLPIDDF